MGAQSPHDKGLYYQWGDVIGHDIAEGYNFNSENYEAKRLNLITTNLDSAHDAARLYYGPTAKMPSIAQYQELINNCTFTYREDGLLTITSNINGNSITIPPGGAINGLEPQLSTNLRSWTTIRANDRFANLFNVSENSISIVEGQRIVGENVMAVHS